MMEWALAILFGIAALLLILSIFKTRQLAKEKQQKMDSSYFSVMEELDKLQEKIRNIELDGEITAHGIGIQEISPKERVLLREILDLFKRGYSTQSISQKKNVSEYEVEHMLEPFKINKSGRGQVANDL
jgi:hypothetical protein